MGQMQKFKREIRSVNGRVLAFDLKHGFGAALGGLFEKIARGKVHDSEVREIYGLEDEGEPQHVRISAGPQLTPSQKTGKYTALVSLHGVALYDLEFQPYCFSTLLLSQVMEQLMNDASVDQIVLDINTPGGHVTGTAEAADAVYKAAKKKPVIGIINPLCASAGYWIGSQCSKLVAVPSADVGSIGVFMCHYDCSAMLADAGIKPTFIYAGEYKTEGNAMEPLSEDARAFYQSEVDQTYDDFLSAVARGRQMSKEAVLAKFGKGRCYAAPVAKRVGMIDEISTIRLALAGVGLTMQMPEDGRRRRGENEQPADQAEAEQDQASNSTEQERAEQQEAESATGQVVSTEGCEKIVFQQQLVGEGDDKKVAVYACNAWPAKAIFADPSCEMYRSATNVVSFAGETLTVVVENGAAVYTKVGITEQGDWVCALADGSKFEPPPAPPENNSDAARAAEVEDRRRRLALAAAI